MAVPTGEHPESPMATPLSTPGPRREAEPPDPWIAADPWTMPSSGQASSASQELPESVSELFSTLAMVEGKVIQDERGKEKVRKGGQVLGSLLKDHLPIQRQSLFVATPDRCLLQSIQLLIVLCQSLGSSRQDLVRKLPSHHRMDLHRSLFHLLPVLVQGQRRRLARRMVVRPEGQMDLEMIGMMILMGR